ncbi:MAG: glycosyltransferase [Cyanobacteria bacterium P01_A01_bin.83]
MSTLNTMPKVAIFIPASATGGAEHYIKNILHLVIENGYKPVLVLPNNDKIINFYSSLEVDSLVGDIAWTGGEEDLTIGSNYLSKLSRQYREATRILELLKPDSVFINLPWVDFGLGISIACHDLQLPSINLIHLCPWRVSLNDLTRQIFQDLAASNSRFFTVSNDNRIQLSLSTGIKQNLIQVFYNSREVDNEYAQCSSKQYNLHRLELLSELDLPLNSYISISVGRFSHQKNFSDILTSFSAVHERLPNYYHLFLGEGELKEYYQQTADDLGISDKIKFLGYRQDVKRFLALSDLFISNSIYEGLALSILEAAQFSCPIIAANSSSAKEIIPDSDYGLLYNPGQYYLLEKLIEFAYFNPSKMKQKAKNLKSRCQENFSLAKFSADLSNILQASMDSQAEAKYSPISVIYDQSSKMLKPKQNLPDTSYQYYGLPKSIIKENNSLPFPWQKYNEEFLAENHQKYLHCLNKIAKQLSHLKVILCFGAFNPNFFRSYYLKNEYLLIIISSPTSDSPHSAASTTHTSKAESLTFSIQYVDHTYWGQEIEPDCIAKFTTFETSSNCDAWLPELDRNPNYEHCYTSRHLIESNFKISNTTSNFDSLSLNLKLINDVFQPSGYYMLGNNEHGHNLELKVLNKVA